MGCVHSPNQSKRSEHEALRNWHRKISVQMARPEHPELALDSLQSANIVCNDTTKVRSQISTLQRSAALAVTAVFI